MREEFEVREAGEVIEPRGKRRLNVELWDRLAGIPMLACRATIVCNGSRDVSIRIENHHRPPEAFVSIKGLRRLVNYAEKWAKENKPQRAQRDLP